MQGGKEQGRQNITFNVEANSEENITFSFGTNPENSVKFAPSTSGEPMSEESITFGFETRRGHDGKLSALTTEKHVAEELNLHEAKQNIGVADREGQVNVTKQNERMAKEDSRPRQQRATLESHLEGPHKDGRLGASSQERAIGTAMALQGNGVVSRECKRCPSKHGGKPLLQVLALAKESVDPPGSKESSKARGDVHCHRLNEDDEEEGDDESKKAQVIEDAKYDLMVKMCRNSGGLEEQAGTPEARNIDSTRTNVKQLGDGSGSGKNVNINFEGDEKTHYGRPPDDVDAEGRGERIAPNVWSTIPKTSSSGEGKGEARSLRAEVEPQPSQPS